MEMTVEEGTQGEGERREGQWQKISETNPQLRLHKKRKKKMRKSEVDRCRAKF